MFVLIPIALVLGFVIIKYGFWAIVFSCIGIDFFMLFFGTMILIDPYMANISGGKVGNGILNVVSAITVCLIYYNLYFKLAKSKKLKYVFILWNIILSFAGAYYMYEALAYLILPLFDIKFTTVIPIFKWEKVNILVYYLIIGVIGVIFTSLRLSITEKDSVILNKI